MPPAAIESPPTTYQEASKTRPGWPRFNQRMRAELARCARWWLPKLAHILSGPLTWTLLATLVLIVANNAFPGHGLTVSLGDTDDAVRLYTVRELLSGASYFDTTLPRLGAPEALVSHWSRLIDVPLALLVKVFQLFTSTPSAEWLTRAIWPLCLFVGLALGFTREARRAAGVWAPGIAMALIVICAISMVQFRPGRIDHHNAQILCAVLGVLLLARSMRTPQTGWWAGMFIGVGLAVGYEGIALVLPVLALGGLMYVLWPTRAGGGLHALLAAAASLLVALLLTTPPGKLLVIHCDALSSNLVSLLCIGAATLGVLARVRLALGARLAIAALGASCGLGVYTGMEPACLAGPFGQVNPAIKPIWLDHVVETQSSLRFALENPSAGFPQLVMIAAGVAAHIALAYRDRSLSGILAASATLLAAALGLWQIKLMPYAIWLCVMPVAILLARLALAAATRSLALRLFAALLVALATLGEAAKPFLSTKVEAKNSFVAVQRVCERTPNVEKLAKLEPGLVAADIGLGAFVATLTPHRVVAAPYHRLDKGILALNAIMTGTPDAAHDVIRKLGVDYIAICVPETAPKAAGEIHAQGLRGILMHNEHVAWLEPLALDLEAMRVWRVAKTRTPD